MFGLSTLPIATGSAYLVAAPDAPLAAPHWEPTETRQPVGPGLIQPVLLGVPDGFGKTSSDRKPPLILAQATSRDGADELAAEDRYPALPTLGRSYISPRLRIEQQTDGTIAVVMDEQRYTIEHTGDLRPARGFSNPRSQYADRTLFRKYSLS